MKAKNRLMGLLYLKFSPREGALALLILLNTSCPNRPALAQSRGRGKIIVIVASYRQLLKGSTINEKRLLIINP